MKNILNSALLLSIIFLFACSELSFLDSNKPKIERVTFEESPVDSAFSFIRPPIQKFTINTEKPQTVTAAKGTEILIPKDCFIDHNGNPVTGNVEIEVIEAFSLSDFVTSGLTTLSEDKLLLSNGMLYLDAKSKGNSLKIKEGTELSVSMPTMGKNDGFQMFTGDGKNWSVDSTMLQEDYLIPLPLDLLYPKGYEKLLHCIITNGEDRTINRYYYDSTILAFKDSEYENSTIATREFKNRFNLLIDLAFAMSLIENEGFLEGFTGIYIECTDLKFNYNLLSIYFENSDKPLYYLDSIAKLNYKNYFNENKKELAVFFKRLHEYKKKYGRAYISFSSDNLSLEEWFLSPLKRFPKSPKVTLKKYNNYGIDLNAEDAYEQLAALNLSPKEINATLEFHFKRETAIKQLEREKKAIEDKKSLSKMYEKTVFSLNKLGWINCDRFYNDPNAGKAEILLTDNSNHTLNFIRLVTKYFSLNY